MEEHRFRCRNCKKIRVKHSEDQRYCGKAACQKARKNAWRREKYEVDPDYRANQAASTQAWLASQGGSAAYFRSYRKRRKERQRKERQHEERQHEERQREERQREERQREEPQREEPQREERQRKERQRKERQRKEPQREEPQREEPQREEQRCQEQTVSADPTTGQARRPLTAASANSDAKTPQSPVKSGRYRLLPYDTANSDAILVELSIIPWG